MSQNILRFFFLVGVLLIIWFSLYAQAEMFQALGGDKLWHVLAFGFLGLTSAFTCRSGRRLLMVVLGLVVFGLGIELTQFIMPDRSADLGDIIANFLGISSGLALAAIAYRLNIRRIAKTS